MIPRPVPVDVSSEHTPINYPSRRDSFDSEYNDLTTTVAASETPDMKEVGLSNPFCLSGFQQQAAASGSQQQASSSGLAPTCGRTPGNRCEVVSQFQVLKGLCREKKVTEIWKVHKLFPKGEISIHCYLEQKAELAVQGECAAQKRLSEAEAEMDIRIWERRNADIALFDTNRELESQRLELYQQINGQIRLKEKTDRARQLRIEELSMQQERNPSTESQFLTQLQDLQNKVNSLTDAKDLFTILRQRAALKHPTLPANP